MKKETPINPYISFDDIFSEEQEIEIIKKASIASSKEQNKLIKLYENKKYI
jgi:hypothetical protein